jgi:hypothetical protein
VIETTGETSTDGPTKPKGRPMRKLIEGALKFRNNIRVQWETMRGHTTSAPWLAVRNAGRTSRPNRSGTVEVSEVLPESERSTPQPNALSSPSTPVDDLVLTLP